MAKLDSKIPAGPLAEKWSKHKADIKVVSPANKRKLDIIVIGTGLGGASAAASLGDLGYAEEGIDGLRGILENPAGSDSRPDLEMLFNAAVSEREAVRQLFDR